MRESLEAITVSKVSKEGINRGNEGVFVGGQCGVGGVVDGIQMNPVPPVFQVGNKGEKHHLKKLGQRAEEGTERVLNELDQNREEPVGMCVDHRKHGSWKRRARATQTKSDKENEVGKECSKEGLGSKKRFVLRDEEDAIVEDEQNGKKIKLGEENWKMIENQVEVASHKCSHN